MVSNNLFGNLPCFVWFYIFILLKARMIFQAKQISIKGPFVSTVLNKIDLTETFDSYLPNDPES